MSIKNKLLFDHSKKLYVKIKFNSEKNVWEKWVSKNKTQWYLDGELKTLDQVIATQQSVINNNHLNLFKIITQKE